MERYARLIWVLCNSIQVSDFRPPLVRGLFVWVLCNSIQVSDSPHWLVLVESCISYLFLLYFSLLYKSVRH